MDDNERPGAKFEEKTNEAGETSYRCTACGYETTSEKNIHRHMEIHRRKTGGRYDDRAR
jgi:tRNA(Ile2) C34 agmatinyltransferase TiaS